MNEKQVYLNKNSRIYYNGKILKGDKMFFNQLTGFGKAEGNVRLDDRKKIVTSSVVMEKSTKK